MLRLVYLGLRGCFRLHSIWVSGTRQIAAVIDFFSRSCFTDRIDPSGYFLEFMPLNEIYFERSAELMP